MKHIFAITSLTIPITFWLMMPRIFPPVEDLNRDGLLSLLFVGTVLFVTLSLVLALLAIAYKK